LVKCRKPHAHRPRVYFRERVHVERLPRKGFKVSEGNKFALQNHRITEW